MKSKVMLNGLLEIVQQVLDVLSMEIFGFVHKLEEFVDTKANVLGVMHKYWSAPTMLLNSVESTNKSPSNAER